jgi:hypothetical protein
MDWQEAQNKIRTHVQTGTDVNSPNSTYRFVESVGALGDSERYGYHNERGFVVSLGKTNKIKVPWSMLRACFAQLCTPNGYDGFFFRERFPLQARDHPCHVHAIGQIFVAAGIARLEEGRYRLVE